MDTNTTVSEVDRLKISQRVNRFGEQRVPEGSKNYKKKFSIDELMKSMVRYKLGMSTT